jgi:hypothetical protein
MAASVKGSNTQREAEDHAEREEAVEVEVHDMSGGDCTDGATGSTPVQGVGG